MTAALTLAGAQFLVEHDTEYRYSSQVAFAQHLACLTPPNLPGQQVADFQMDIEPAPPKRWLEEDSFGNIRTAFSLAVAHETLRVRTRSRVRVQPRFAAIAPELSPPWERVRDALQYVAGAPFDPAAEFSFASTCVPRDPALQAYALASFTPGRPLLAAAFELMHRIYADFRYDPASTDVGTPVLEAFAARAGVCQDYTHVMIGCMRSLGLAARYISGYLYTQPGVSCNVTHAAAPSAAALVGADASHAWVAVYCPRFAWVEADPTNDLIPGVGHVRLALGRDYADLAPLRGVVQGGGAHRLRVAVKLTVLAD